MQMANTPIGLPHRGYLDQPGSGVV